MLEALSSVLMLILFLVPGYVWKTVESQFIFLDKRLEWEKFALGLLARSTVVYLVWGQFIYRGWVNDWLDTMPWTSTLTLASTAIVSPAVFGFLCGVVRRKGWIPALLKKAKMPTFEQHHVPTAWDYVFSKITPKWAIVSLDDGTKIYGFLGPASYFSSDGDDRDIFISDVLHRGKDGKMEVIPNTAGVYTAKDKIALIEFLKR